MTTKIVSLELTKKFIKGLENYGLTYDEIINSNWKYCGGRIGRHLNYFKLCFKNDDLPDKVNECVCGHHLRRLFGVFQERLRKELLNVLVPHALDHLPHDGVADLRVQRGDAHRHQLSEGRE